MGLHRFFYIVKIAEGRLEAFGPLSDISDAIKGYLSMAPNCILVKPRRCKYKLTNPTE